MGVPPRSWSPRWLAASLLVVSLALALGLFWRASDPPDDAPGREAPATAARAAPPRPEAPAPAPASAPPPPPAAAPPEVPGLDTPSFEAAAAHPVDLARLREELPDNLYWRLGAPTTDPRVLQQREEDTRRWNTQLGKVQSNTATEEEIHEYYAHRRAVSEDFIQFARRVLEAYGPQLPEQERGLYELSIRMHSTRLEEIPRQIDDALARKQRQDALREDWRGTPARP